MSLQAGLMQDSDKFLRIVMCGMPFLDDTQASEAFACGIKFLANYIRAAQQSAAAGTLRYFVRPKFHVLQHLVLHCRRASHRSAHLDSTWLDEDFIGKMMRRLKGLHPRTSSLRVLQRYLLDESCFD